VLDVIDLNISKKIIVLPWKSPLDEVLEFSDHPNDVQSFCTQFIEGMAFLHQHKVAHCDLQPGNVVVNTRFESLTLPWLFIIDFGLALLVKSEEMMIEGWCGTLPWIAPKVGTKDSPAQWYGPVLADQWACRQMIK
jgi:serine/threonine protein kinase